MAGPGCAGGGGQRWPRRSRTERRAEQGRAGPGERILRYRSAAACGGVGGGGGGAGAGFPGIPPASQRCGAHPRVSVRGVGGGPRLQPLRVRRGGAGRCGGGADTTRCARARPFRGEL